MSTKQTALFLDLPDPLSLYETARVAVLPVPYEATVSYGGGTAQGPAAIINASSQVELYDEELGGEPCEVGVATLPSPELKHIVPAELSGVLSPIISKLLHDGKLPIILGGEHAITPAAVRSIVEVHKHLTVVQLDAHADLRQEYEGEPMSHACAMARVRELCPAVQIGIRNLSAPEAAWVHRENLPVFFAKDMRTNDRWMSDAIARIATEEVYLTIDVDAFDSSIMPATGTPEPGGLGWYEVTDFLRQLMGCKKVVGLDIVELAPSKGLHACDFLVAKLAYKCIGYWRERQRLD